jgi:hypothetical protein
VCGPTFLTCQLTFMATTTPVPTTCEQRWVYRRESKWKDTTVCTFRHKEIHSGRLSYVRRSVYDTFDATHDKSEPQIYCLTFVLDIFCVNTSQYITEHSLWRDRRNFRAFHVKVQRLCADCEGSWSQWCTQEFFSGGWVSTNSVEDRRQRELGSGGRQPPSQGFWRQL